MPPAMLPRTTCSTTAGRSDSLARRAWPFSLYFVVILVCFFRTALFFYLDEYIGLWRLAQAPSVFKFILKPHNEHFIPLFHAFWAVEVFAFREKYWLYILVNVILLALIGSLWECWLCRIGVQPALAVIAPLLAVTCLAQSDNVMCGWQAPVLLSSLALVGALLAYSHSRLICVGILSCCAALFFSNAYILPAVMAVYFICDYFHIKDRRLLAAAAGLVGIFAMLLGLPTWSGAVTSSHLFSAIWEGKDTFQKTVHLIWLAWYTISIAFYGPLNHLLMGWVPDGLSNAMTLHSLGAVGIVLGATWNSPSRGLVIKLLVLQVALFVFISPFRHTPSFVGFSGRYYTSGMIPWLSAVALSLSELWRRKGISVRWLKVILLLLVLLAARNARCAVIKYDWFLVQCGHVARVDYYRTKEWLRRHRGEPVGNNMFNQSVAPFLDLKMLLPVISVLDPSFRTTAVSVKDVSYVGNTVIRRGWGPIFAGQPAIQTFQVDRPLVVTKIELLVSRNREYNGVSHLCITGDAGRTLWRTTVPSNIWPFNTWLANPVDLVRLEPQRVYHIQVASTSTNPAAAPTIWMNDRADSYPYGGTQAPDGAVGDFCFRLALMEP